MCGGIRAVEPLVGGNYFNGEAKSAGETRYAATTLSIYAKPSLPHFSGHNQFSLAEFHTSGP